LSEAQAEAQPGDPCEHGRRERPRDPAWVPWLAGVVPLIAYVITAGAHAYWLDSAEFTAAAIDLDIAHPPGHPVAALWGRAFCLLPVGPLPFRVAVAQGVAAAIGAGALQVAFARTLRVFEVQERATRLVLSLALTWLLAFSYGYWFQAVRAEVYALQTMLICLALERLVALADDQELCDVRPLYAACLWLGIGLANHHFMSVLTMPALLSGTWRALQKRGPRVLGWCLLSGSVGLSSYLYLPLRAGALPPMDLGHPVNLRAFWWVISAQVYARRIGSEATQPMDERFADLAVILLEHFSLVALALALLGAYFMARSRALWSVSYVWGVTALIALCGRAWLNPVRNNPDVLGYMLPGFAGYLMLVAGGLLVPLTVLSHARARALVQRGLAALLLLCALWQLARSEESASLRTFTATDRFAQARARALPSGAVAFLTSPESAFLHWEREAVEHARPDVDIVPTAFVNYGGKADVMLAARPELRAALRDFRASTVLSLSSLDALAKLRPVVVEPDLTASYPLFARLVPDGLLYRFAPAAPDHASLLRAAATRARALDQLSRELAAELSVSETRRQLLWLHFMDALYYASQREVALALASTARGLNLQPTESELLRLKRVLLEEPAQFALRDFLPR
jgi:hypothetical protein